MDAVEGGVVVCDEAGTVRQHDREALRLLTGAEGAQTQTQETDASSGPLVGRSVFDWVDAAGLEPVFAALTGSVPASDADNPGDAEPPNASPADGPVTVVVRVGGDRLLRVRLRPVHGTDPPGVLLTLHPRTPAPASGGDSHRVLRELIEHMRAPLASIRAAIETMTQYPGMDAAATAQFEQIIAEQTVVLNDQLEQAVDAFAALYRDAWALDAVALGDLARLLARQVETAVEVPVERRVEAPGRRVRVDVQALGRAMAFLARRTVHAVRCNALTLHAHPVGDVAALDLGWSGPAVRAPRLRKWQREALSWGDTIVEMPLTDLLNHHDAQILSQDNPPDGARLRVLLP